MPELSRDERLTRTPELVELLGRVRVLGFKGEDTRGLSVVDLEKAKKAADTQFSVDSDPFRDRFNRGEEIRDASEVQPLHLWEIQGNIEGKKWSELIDGQTGLDMIAAFLAFPDEVPEFLKRCGIRVMPIGEAEDWSKPLNKAVKYDSYVVVRGSGVVAALMAASYMSRSRGTDEIPVFVDQFLGKETSPAESK